MKSAAMATIFIDIFWFGDFIALIHLTYQTIAIARRQPVPPNERKRRPGFHPRHTTIHSPGGLVPASLARGT